jgi:hypothetical protein
MTVRPQRHDEARVGRALDRLASHCDLAVRRSERIEQRRRDVREQLERELGPDLVERLLSGLAPAS